MLPAGPPRRHGGDDRPAVTSARGVRSSLVPGHGPIGTKKELADYYATVEPLIMIDAAMAIAVSTT